ncbi:hypothetical protein D0862_08060 [Hortaea werneckii]|uniref:Uncharacterized protein n=1 Tax=Hortaea werneckii TaxID=91943 RepID=A0A3M7G8L1_HORWE|nr:hypothetical protein D0862_08060 [Hortaea werneckii]
MMQQASSSSVADGGSVLGKRPADESNLNDDQRFTKRFNLLSLGKPTRYVLLNAAADQAAGNRQEEGDGRNAHASSNYYIPVSPSLKPNASASDVQSNGKPASSKGEELMAVDDTRDRVYIHNLDDELAEIESSADEERLIFLPDIEKKLSRLPSHVLTGQRDDKNQELVLYSVPQSLTPSEESDITRKAILEARQRAREKAAEEARQEDMTRRYQTGDCDEDVEPAHGYSGGLYIECESTEEKVMTDQYFLAFKAAALTGDCGIRIPSVSDKFNSIFLVGLVKELSKKKRDDLEDAVARCAFHEHASGAANCYRNQFK